MNTHTKQNITAVLTIALQIGLFTADGFCLKYLGDNNEETKALTKIGAGIGLTVCVISQVAIAIATALHNQQQHSSRQNRTGSIATRLSIDGNNIDSTIKIEAPEWHDDLQTVLKLTFGASGWQLGFELALYYLKFIYNSDISTLNWKELVTWPATGIGAALFLSLSVFLTQIVLSQLPKGTHWKYTTALCLQLVFSVLIADMFWQPVADVVMYYVNLITRINPLLGKIAEPMLALPGYILLSLFFKTVHNASNKLRNIIDDYFMLDDKHVVFVCENEFVATLSLAYFCFYFLPGPVATGINDLTADIDTSVVSCIAAGIGTGIGPALFIILHAIAELKQTEQTHDNNDIESAALVSSSDSPAAAEDVRTSEHNASKEGLLDGTTKTINPSCLQQTCSLFGKAIFSFAKGVTNGYIKITEHVVNATPGFRC